MTRNRLDFAGHVAKGSASDAVNVGDAERWLSLAGGGFLVWLGLQKRSLGGLGLAALGSSLVYRGATGHCSVYSALHVDTAGHNPMAAVAAGRGVKVVCSVTINRPARDLYDFWRNFENFPRFFKHLVSVKAEGNRSHWVTRGLAGNVEWDAEIINEEVDRLIAWRSLEGSQVSTAGSVHFNELSNGRGTEVRVDLKYDPPGGKLGSWLAWLFGQDPQQSIRDDLRRFKQLMEAGEIATVEGQSSGRR